LLLGYENNKKIVFLESGSGGVNELAGKLQPSDCYYGYARLQVKDNETTRTKFVFITFKGENAPVMRKGNMSVHITNVKSKIKDFSLQFNAVDPSEVTEEEVLKRIKSINY
jgi:hypothetical protein